MKKIRLFTLVSCLGLSLLLSTEAYARKYHVSLNDGTHQIIVAKNKVDALLKFSQLYGNEDVKEPTETNPEGIKTNDKSAKDKECTAVLCKRKKGGLIALMSKGNVFLLH